MKFTNGLRLMIRVKSRNVLTDFDDPRLQEIEMPEDYTTVIQQRDKVNPDYDPSVEIYPERKMDKNGKCYWFGWKR